MRHSLQYLNTDGEPIVTVWCDNRFSYKNLMLWAKLENIYNAVAARVVSSGTVLSGIYKF